MFMATTMISAAMGTPCLAAQKSGNATNGDVAAALATGVFAAVEVLSLGVATAANFLKPFLFKTF